MAEGGAVVIYRFSVVEWKGTEREVYVEAGSVTEAFEKFHGGQHRSQTRPRPVGPRQSVALEGTVPEESYAPTPKEK